MLGKEAKLFAVISCKNTLGEGVVWDPRVNAAVWTDIEECRLYRSTFPFENFESFPAPERIGSFGLLEGRQDQVAAAFETGFGYFSYNDGAVDWLDRPALPKGARFNDGRVDRCGVFWAGSMIEDVSLRRQSGGALYRLGNDGKAKAVFDGVQISNSLCWSPDGTVMYFADTPLRQIHAFDFEEGTPSNKRVFAETERGAYPDGSAVDAEGFLWNAQWGAGQVVRYAPDGRVDFTLKVPAPHVSCAAFGGPDLNLLLITTARAEMTAEALAAAPQSGALFVYETSHKGLPESLCVLPGSDRRGENAV